MPLSDLIKMLHLDIQKLIQFICIPLQISIDFQIQDALAQIGKSQTQGISTHYQKLFKLFKQAAAIEKKKQKLSSKMTEKSEIFKQVQNYESSLSPYQKILLLINKHFRLQKPELSHRLQLSLLQDFSRFSLTVLMYLTSYLIRRDLLQSHAKSVQKLFDTIFGFIQNQHIIVITNQIETETKCNYEKSYLSANQNVHVISYINFMDFISKLFKIQYIGNEKKLALLTYILTNKDQQNIRPFNLMLIVDLLMKLSGQQKFNQKLIEVLISNHHCQTFKVDCAKTYLSYCAFISNIIYNQQEYMANKSQALEPSAVLSIKSEIQRQKTIILDVLDRLIKAIDQEITKRSNLSFGKVFRAKNAAAIATFLSNCPIFIEEFWLKILSLVQDDSNDVPARIHLFQLLTALCLLKKSKFAQDLYENLVQENKTNFCNRILKVYNKLSQLQKLQFKKSMSEINAMVFNREILPYLIPNYMKPKSAKLNQIQKDPVISRKVIPNNFNSSAQRKHNNNQVNNLIQQPEKNINLLKNTMNKPKESLQIPRQKFNLSKNQQEQQEYVYIPIAQYKRFLFYRSIKPKLLQFYNSQPLNSKSTVKSNLDVSKNDTKSGQSTRQVISQKYQQHKDAKQVLGKNKTRNLSENWGQNHRNMYANLSERHQKQIKKMKTEFQKTPKKNEASMEKTNRLRKKTSDQQIKENIVEVQEIQLDIFMMNQEQKINEKQFQEIMHKQSWKLDLQEFAAQKKKEYLNKKVSQ